jgi:hypothetical protein
MQKYIQVSVVASLLALAGCGNFYRGMYEGLQKREQIKDPTVQGRPAEPAISYDQYQKAREQQLEKNTQQ